MPLFDFKCPDCNHKIEEIIGLEKAHSVDCPFCGGKMSRQFGAPSIIIAGNPGPKIKTRPALAKELRKQGFNSPLFSSREHEDRTDWTLKRAGVK